jgi:hypothetical protein
MRVESYLPASGRAETPSEVTQWVESVVSLLEQSDRAPFEARVWTYRRGSHTVVCCDIDGEAHAGLAINFLIGGEVRFDTSDPVVPDAAEALHWIGLLTQRLGADVRIGRRQAAVPAVGYVDDVHDLSAEEVAECEARAARRFRIHHHYDIGDQSVYVESKSGEVDVPLAAAFIVAKTQEWWGNVLVSNLGVAAALVEFYGCEHMATATAHIEVDLYDQSRYSAAVGAPELERAGLRAYLRRHVSPAGDDHRLEEDPHGELSPA